MTQETYLHLIRKILELEKSGYVITEYRFAYNKGNEIGLDVKTVKPLK